MSSSAKRTAVSGRRQRHPACPDHTEKAKLWRLLDAERWCKHRTTRFVRDVLDRRRERLVSRAPPAHYFAVGKIARDQVEDYARRKGWTSPKPSAGLRLIWATSRAEMEDTGGHRRR